MRMRRLVPEAMRPRWKDRKLDRAKLSCSTFMLYLGIEGDVGDLAHHTILLSRDYERNIHEITNGILPERALDLCAACGRDRPVPGADGPYEPLRARAGAEPALRHRLGAARRRATAGSRWSG